MGLQLIALQTLQDAGILDAGFELSDQGEPLYVGNLEIEDVGSVVHTSVMECKREAPKLSLVDS